MPHLSVISQHQCPAGENRFLRMLDALNAGDITHVQPLSHVAITCGASKVICMWQPRDNTRGEISLTVAHPSLAGQLKTATAQELVRCISLCLCLLAPSRSHHPFYHRRRFGQFPALPSFVGPCRKPATESDDSSSEARYRGLRRAAAWGRGNGVRAGVAFSGSPGGKWPPATCVCPGKIVCAFIAGEALTGLRSDRSPDYECLRLALCPFIS